MDILNCESGPVVLERKICPKLLALKQSNNVSGALPRLPDPLVPELQPVAPDG